MPTGALRQAVTIQNIPSDSNILLYDGFDYDAGGALGWVASGAGSIARNTTYKYAGYGSLGVTTLAAAGSFEEAVHSIPLPSSRKIGAEFYFAAQSFYENLDIVRVGFDYNSQKNAVYDGYYFDINRSYAGIMVGTGQTVLLSDFGPIDFSRFTADVVWHYCKFVIDLDARHYATLQIDGINADVSAYQPFTQGVPVLNDMLSIHLSARSNILLTAVLTLFDEVRVTNEY